MNEGLSGPDELPAPKTTYKIIVLGDSGVGKTCLTHRFCHGQFPVGPLDATIGVDFKEKTVKTLVSGQVMRLQLWDTAGQERFRKSMIAHYYRNVAAVVFVYDVKKRESFDSMANWLEECKRYNLTPEIIPMIMVGNKLDGNFNPKNMQVKTLVAQR